MSRTLIKVTANQRRSIVSQYNKGAGLYEIGAKFKISAPVVRRILTAEKVKIRKRGRPVVHS